VLHLPLLKYIVVFHVNTLNVGMFMVFENEAVSCNRTMLTCLIELTSTK